ncbi:MAG: LamG-like jellyroll fold domain-containing protein, partial [Planctomycetota bacterium]
MFRKNPTNMLKTLSIMAVVIVVTGTASAANSFTVTVMPESSTTWYAGYLDEGYQSESDDPLAPFGGQSVMFKGYTQPGGANEMRKNAYLVCRYKIEFDQNVTINSVAVTGAGDNMSQGNSAVLRLLDENMDEITVERLTGFNMLLTHTLNAGGVLGRIFYIDEFDYSMGYRYRNYIEIAYNDFEVTNTDDSGSGSLRQAILEANTNPGLDIIAFNISGRSSGPYTIQPTSPLPHITDPVVIDGYTQPGAAPATDEAQATLLIELDGIKAGVGSVSGLIILAGNSTVRGLVINRFGDVGIHIQEKGGNIIEGNYIGTDVTGTVDQGNIDDGIRIWDAPDNMVGGATAEARNIISGNNDMGVEIILSGATGNKVQGNYIGTDVTGTTDLGNSTHGVFINASGNTIGDSSSGTGNVISGNGGNGIIIHEIGATGNRILGNFIGTDVTGTVDLGNQTDGVQIRSAANNTIGGITAEARNVISGNNVRGISIQGDFDRGGRDAAGNLVQGNFIGTDVTGTTALGNTQDGVQIRGAANNTIGGATAGARNVISSNNTGGGWGGISIINHPNLHITGASGNLVQGNFIGTDVTGTGSLGNRSGGVIIEAAANNTLTDNTISNNRYGIRLESSGDNQIYNNNFIDNITQAYATIGRRSNIFNLEKPIGGNYWSDWMSPDTDGDGFVDYAYAFIGGMDYLPWARQDGWLPTPAPIPPDIAVTDPNLVGWWKFDETSRPPGSDSRGRGNDDILAYDSSGHGNDGILVGNPQWVAGKIGGALKFDGNGDYVDCGYDPNLNITNEVTVAAWIKLSATGIDQKVGSNQSGTAGGYKMTVFFDNKVEFEIRTSGNTPILNRDVSGGTVLQRDVWYHVAGVYSQKGNYIRTYVDGNFDRELVTTQVLGASPGPFMIGCETFETSHQDHHFNGVMDDLRIYNRTL